MGRRKEVVAVVEEGGVGAGVCHLDRIELDNVNGLESAAFVPSEEVLCRSTDSIATKGVACRVGSERSSSEPTDSLRFDPRPPACGVSELMRK